MKTTTDELISKFETWIKKDENMAYFYIMMFIGLMIGLSLMYYGLTGMHLFNHCSVIMLPQGVGCK